MFARRSLALFGVVVALALLLGNGQSVVAQPSDPPAGALPPWGDPTTLPPWHLEAGGKPYQNAEGLWAMPAAAERGPQSAPDAAPLSTGGPDDFGYTWDDSVLFNWIDTTSGIDAGIAGDDTYGLVDIGFPFRFYEQTWDRVYVTTNGVLVFGSETAACCGRYRMPRPSYPNNLIAPLWADLTVGSPYNTGAIRVLRGGTAPLRYFVVSWHDVTYCCTTGGTDYKTFQVILFESGNVLMQYRTIVSDWKRYSIGIEDSVGSDGLEYPYQAANGRAIRFTRPGPAARVQLWPAFHGQFTQPGSVASHRVPIRNTGELGADTYDVSLAAGWATGVYRSDGVTPLTDTDGDGMLDTGPVAQGSTAALVVKVWTSPAAQAGDNDTAALTARSSLNPAKQKTATLRTAVPSSFVQVYRDNADGAMTMSLIRPEAQIDRKATPDRHYGSDMAVAEMANHNLIYAWSKFRCLDSSCSVGVSEIEYTVLDVYGAVVRSLAKLTDHSAATVRTYDYDPAIAVAPDGRIGLLWYRYLYNRDNAMFNYNMYWAVLAPNGNVVVGPTNLTNNTVWGRSGDLNVPWFFAPEIVAAGDNRFLLAWTREHQEGSGWVDDIWYAVIDSAGGVARGPTRLTEDTPGWEDNYYNPALTRLSDDRTLLAFQRGGDYGDIYGAVLDSAGNVVRSLTNLSGDGDGIWDWSPDAAQLPNGRVVLAWTGYAPRNVGEQGWTGEYFNNETLTGTPVLVRTDPTIDFRWDMGSPHPSVTSDHFSVRWRGAINVPAGAYQFQMGSDDGSRLWIDDQLVMDRWNECCQSWTQTLTLGAGNHQVRMEMHEHDGAAWASLSWWSAPSPFIKFAVFDRDLNRLSGPTLLNNPAAVTGNDYVSVTTDADGRAILTWMDYDWNYRPNLYYALVAGDGAVVTPPTIFRTSQAASPYIFTSYEGYGNTSYHWTPPADAMHLYLPLLMK